MKRLLLVSLLVGLVGSAQAFNLISDIDNQTTWTLGQVAAAGTSIDLSNGQYDVSEFAQIANYRMISLWYGGIEVPQGDGTMKLTDSAKAGFNLAYLFNSFVNKPPALIQNLVVGPAIGGNLASTPRTLHYFVDINYQFGAPTTPTPTK